MKREKTGNGGWSRSLRQLAGNALVSALFGIALLSAIAAGSIALHHHYQTEQFATNRAAGIGAALKAADSYARKYETQLLNGQAIVGFANPRAPSIQELVAAGLMTQAFNEAGTNGGPLRVAVRTEPTGCVAKCQLAVSVYPTGSILNKAGQPDSALAAKIAHAVPGGSGWTNLSDQGFRELRVWRQHDLPALRDHRQVGCGHLWRVDLSDRRLRAAAATAATRATGHMYEWSVGLSYLHRSLNTGGGHGHGTSVLKWCDR